MSLISLVDKIITATNEGDFVLGIFLDLTNAFDTVNHNILLKKLYQYGVRGIALNWFESYLYNRQQYVAYNNCVSNKLNISCGVPQGSILGPILFLLYVNDMVNASSVLFSILFADDTNLFLQGKNIDELFNVANTEIIKVLDWLLANKLHINVSKTN